MQVTKTRNELIREAAERLKIVGTGQGLEPEYAARLEANLDALFMQLMADGICNVVNDNFIPIEWFDALSGLLANMSASIGGASFDPQIKGFYEAQLRRLTASGPSYSVLESEYF